MIQLIEMAMYSFSCRRILTSVWLIATPKLHFVFLGEALRLRLAALSKEMISSQPFFNWMTLATLIREITKSVQAKRK